ncbi:effector-associated constant component EACC1 [Streptomyces litchfieldiae]|uniref:Uncharacterized protein n=1 Tax=Streptomyces litchfieldiae TaxID=3075543 RepID=A0ABU2MLZ2_9ACTN|nr:hypothetical protein [Streptomyces sp. DSM 44938]MDT0342432.1 hypothetical protein [Streptomyces sp. DSM 44938]
MREIRIHVVAGGHPDGAEEDLRSLRNWLAADESLRREVRASLTASGPAPAGAMGIGFDILQLAIGSGLSAGALAVSVLQWRDSRRNRPGLVLRRGAIEVEIPADGVHPDTLERVIALLDQDPDGPAGGDGSAS